MGTQEQLDLSLSEQARLIDKCVKMQARIELLEKVAEAALILCNHIHVTPKTEHLVRPGHQLKLEHALLRII